MNHFKKLLPAVLVAGLIFTGAAAAFAQTEARQPIEPSCEVSLQLIVGSNDTAKRGELPANLNAITKRLRSTFPFSSFRLANTFLGRISNNGSYEYKSLGDVIGQDPAASPHALIEWNIGSFRIGPTAGGTPGFQATAFRFGARVPVMVGAREENGKMMPAVNYESIGMGLGRVGFAENVPTLIGTVDLPGADGTIFLVMTVRSADL
jgi:hypothetical protein